MNFANLNTITSYSTLHSTIKIPDLVKTAKKRGYKSLAITDINVLHGIVEFYDRCLAEDIKPIIGMTLITKGLFSDGSVKFVLLAENTQGYQNLLKISTLRNIDQNYQNLVDFKDYLTGITVIIHPEASDLNLDNYLEVIELYRNICKHLYLGYAPTITTPELLRLNDLIYQDNLLSFIYLDDVYYLNSEDEIALKVLRAIDEQKKININDPLLNAPGRHELKSVKELIDPEKGDLFESIENASKLADQLNVEIVKEKTKLPHFPTPNNDSAQYLEELVMEGLKKIGHSTDEEYLKRVENELKIIVEMGFADYFLIIWDIINFAEKSDIQLGAGRGSAAGSLVAYTLGISKVDPIKYGLIFERFLNPERVNMPDIDLDVPDDRRSDIIKYLQSKYGRDNFAQVITFSTLGVKQALRDCLRVFSIDDKGTTRWVNSIPKSFHITLSQTYQVSETFRNLVEGDNLGRTIFNVLQKVEGLPRQASTHAAAVVISEYPLVNKIPLQLGSNEVLLTQYVYHDVEELGLLKIDILGLRNLSILKKMIDLIRKYDRPNFSTDQINLDDQETLKIFHDGDTDGIFQFESAGIKRVLKNMDVTDFNDIVTTNALYRPGPMGQIDTYIEHKKARSTELDPNLRALEPIISNTYGVIVYQEQVMQAANLMAGFPLSEADILRRAMSKKNKILLDKYKGKFVIGSQNNGYSKEEGEKVFDLIEYFSNYGFNKSHSVAYSMLAFWLAFVKAHFPLHFFTVQLGASLGNESKLRNLIIAARKKSLSVVSPNVNQSFLNFTDNGKEIIAGMIIIKGLRRDFINNIIEKRLKYGNFKNLNDLLSKVSKEYLKLDYFLQLIQAGACDVLNNNRKEMVENLKISIDTITFSHNNLNLFEKLKPKWNHYSDYSQSEKLDFEHNAFGFYLNGSPFDQFGDLANIYHPLKISDLKNSMTGWLFVMVTKIRTIRDKNDRQMAFITMEDEDSKIEGVVFANNFFDLHYEFEENKMEAVFGQAKERNGLNFQIRKMVPLEEAKEIFINEKLFLNITGISSTKLSSLKKILVNNHGLTPVYLYDKNKSQNTLLNIEFWVKMNNDVEVSFIQLLGKEAVVYQKQTK